MPKFSISKAVASPLLIMKFEWIVLTEAPPFFIPLQPAFSIKAAAYLPGGFLKVLPDVFSFIGWELSLFNFI